MKKEPCRAYSLLCYRTAADSTNKRTLAAESVIMMYCHCGLIQQPDSRYTFSHTINQGPMFSCPD
ncbi:hypothetical protein P0Y67_20825, partial [Photobacterium sp. SP02]|uniref:hypothetical protein n=1 Tax=Photobacterium sp. SP02 TaxID=3032280 RepID=UPI003145076D